MPTEGGYCNVADDGGSGEDGRTSDPAAATAADAGSVDSPYARGRLPLSWAAGNGQVVQWPFCDEIT